MGFDPLVNEVARLNAAEDRTRVRYEAAWITSGAAGLEAKQHPAGKRVVDAFSVASSRRACRALNYDYEGTHFNSGDEVVRAERRFSLDEWHAANPSWTTDFLKVDTDGYDLHVLRGGDTLLAGDHRPLGVATEVMFQEACHTPNATFGEIDCCLRARGYRLFDLDTYKFSRGALPQPFAYDLLAQTHVGSLQFGDALYLLDPVLDDEAFDWLRARPDRRGFQKLVMLYAAHGMPDCAAQLLTTCRTRGVVLAGIDTDESLETLARNNPLGAESYSAYVRAFDEDPRRLFPTRLSADTAEAADANAGESADSAAAAGVSGPDAADGDSDPDDWLAALSVGPAGLRESGMIVTTGRRGHACFGPYRGLPAGSYRLRCAVVRTSGRRSKRLPEAELVIDETTRQRESLDFGPGGTGRVEMAFAIGEAEVGRPVQFRLGNPRGVSLVIAGLRLERVDDAGADLG